MQTPRISRDRQQRSLEALAKGGNAPSAAIHAGAERLGLEEARGIGSTFAAEWDEAEKVAAHKLEHEAWRRAVDGVAEPLVSEGKLVRDDDGRPLSIQRYSDALLIELLRVSRARKSRGRAFFEAALGSPLMRRVALFLLVAFVALATASLALQLLRDHLLIAAFH
jgi:hypothetical protein